MKTMPLTTDLKNIITTVTHTKPRCIFNDKRKSFERRYKFSGIYGVSANDIREINKCISEKYPEFQFVIQNSDKVHATYGSGQFFSGLSVKVF